jgi:hypothetical protein
MSAIINLSIRVDKLPKEKFVMGKDGAVYEKPTIKMIKVFDYNIEKILHNEYKDFRVRGEWFDLNKVQINYICTKY